MSTFANDLFTCFEERWNEVNLLFDMIGNSTEQLEIDALCRATTVLIIANFEGFLVETLKVFINDINRFGNFRNTPYKMQTVHCSQFLDVSEKGNQGRLKRLIESLSELNAKYVIEPFIYTVNKNPKPAIIEDYFIKLGGKNFFSYITDSDLEKVFENDYEFNSLLIQKLHANLLSGTIRFPYTVDISVLGYNLENKVIRDCLWMTFLNGTLEKRHSVAHGMTLDNVSSPLELRDILEKIKILELSFAVLCCHSLTA